MIHRLKRHHNFMLSYGYSLVLSFFRPVTIFLFFISSSIILLSSVGFYLLEKDTNPKMTSLLDSIYFTVATMTTVGYGDITPHSAPGKILAIVMMIVGAGFFVSYTAVLSSSMIEIEQQHLKKKEDTP